MMQRKEREKRKMGSWEEGDRVGGGDREEEGGYSAFLAQHIAKLGRNIIQGITVLEPFAFLRQTLYQWKLCPRSGN